MKTFVKTVFGTALILLPITGFTEEIPMTEENWELRGTSEFTEYQGKPAIFLNHGLAILKDQKFQNGIIEFDIAFSEIRGFMGINFRIKDATSYENFYFRSHQSGNPDANQYTPAYNSQTGWQIYYGPQYSTPVDYNFDAWQHVKILVKGNAAEFYLDGEEPFLHVGDLLNENISGDISLSSFFTGAYFSNFSFTENDEVELIGTPVAHEPWPENLIESFEVVKGAVSAKNLSAEDFTGKDWVNLPVEANGIANLAKINGISEEAATTLVRLRVRSETNQTKTLKFGYSDKVSVFVNGQPITGGDNTYMTRDYRYLGTVGLFDEVYLNLKEGENEIVFAITEAFGGWAVMAAFENMEGISIIR